MGIFVAKETGNHVYVYSCVGVSVGLVRGTWMNSRHSFRISISIGRGSWNAIVAQTAKVNNMITLKNVTPTPDYTSTLGC